MPAVEIFEHIRQLYGRGVRIEPDDPVDDMVGARLVRRIEVARLDRRFERAHDDPGRIRAQIQRLSV